VPRRLARTVSLAVFLVLGLATPAFAADEGGTSTAAKVLHPWHYWIAFVLLGGFVLFVIAEMIMYYLKVIRGPRR
jgi:hypothetical protein